MSNANHLLHIKNSLPKDIRSAETSFYPIALEGWRRGLKLKFYNDKRGNGTPSAAVKYSLSDEKNEYFFNCARSSEVKKSAITKVVNKAIAYKHMKEKGVPVPESTVFNFEKTTIEKMCEYGESVGFPLVVKPTNMAGGKGVITNISSKSDLKKSLLEIKNELNVSNIIVEKYFEGGSDFRFYVIGDNVVAATKFYSPNVVGDGRNNVEKLMQLRNIEIKNNIADIKRTIKVDKEMKDFMKESNKSLEYIPEEGERVFLRRHGTHLGKRLSVDCTETIDSKFKKYAVDALKSIPGLPTGSVDMIINEDENEGIVNEINTRGEIKMHIFPSEGQGRDVPKHLIDYYFPDSEKINNHFYFEYSPIREAFLNGYADEISIPRYPRNTHYMKKLHIEGEFLGTSYLNRVKRRAAGLYIKGQIKYISTNRVEITAISTKKKLDTFEKYIEDLNTAKSKVDQIKSSKSDIFQGTNSLAIEVSWEKDENSKKQIKTRF